MRTRGEYVGVADFGSRNIRVLIARADLDGPIEIVGHGEAPGHGCIDQGIIQDVNAVKEAFKYALMQAENEARYSVPSLFCGVHGKNAETFIKEGCAQVPDERIGRRQMDEARGNAMENLRKDGTQIITCVTGEQWYVDGQAVAEPLGIRGNVLKVRTHLARIPTIVQENIVSCVEAQGREMEDVIFLPLASALGCLTPEDMELGAAVLDIGRRTTGLAVVQGGQILGTHCFEWGGYHLTCDVTAGLHVSFAEADELILEYGLSSEFLNAQMEETFEEDEDDEDDEDEEDEEDEDEDEEDDDEPGFVEEEGAAETDSVVKLNTVVPGEGAAETDSVIKLNTVVPGKPAEVSRYKLDIILYARMLEQMQLVWQHLEREGLTGNLVRGIVLTGGASIVKNQQALADWVFPDKCPCRIGYPRGVEITPEEAQNPEYSAATGIVRHAFAFREAARNGRVDSRGPIAGSVKAVLDGIRKYFF